MTLSRTANEIGPIVDRLFSPLIAPLGDPEPTKSVGILVGVTMAGERSYFPFGQVDLHQDGSSSIEDIAVCIGSKPQGMSSTQANTSAVTARIIQTYAYVEPNGGSPAYTTVKPPEWVLTSAGLGAGALSSTLADMLTFLEAEISTPERHLDLAIKQTQTPPLESNALSMGLGWQPSNHSLDKNGGLGSHETYMAFDRARKIGVFVFGNTSGGSTGDVLTGTGRKLLGELRHLEVNPSKFPKPDTTPQCP